MSLTISCLWLLIVLWGVWIPSPSGYASMKCTLNHPRWAGYQAQPQDPSRDQLGVHCEFLPSTSNFWRWRHVHEYVCCCFCVRLFLTMGFLWGSPAPALDRHGEVSTSQWNPTSQLGVQGLRMEIPPPHNSSASALTGMGDCSDSAVCDSTCNIVTLLP